MTKHQFLITGMDCADCARKLEKGVINLDGVHQCQVNFMTAKMEIDGRVDLDAITQRVQSLGYGLSPTPEPSPPRSRGQKLLALLRQPRNIFTLIGLIFIITGFAISWIVPQLPTLPTALFIIGGLFGLTFPARAGWAAFRNGHGLDMNVLMSIAAVGAFFIGEYAEAAAVIVLFSLGEALESYTVEHARDSIRSLNRLAPNEAIVLRPCLDCQGCRGRALPDGSGLYEQGPCPWCDSHEEMVSIDSLAIGEKIVIKPGERIPMDGQVVRGHSAVNQAPITGESVPVEKMTGAEVFAGTINGDGLLTVEVSRLAADNTLSRLIYLVEAAQSKKTPTQRFVDRFARIYTPAVVVGAGLIATLPPLLLGQPFLDTPAGHGWLYRGLTLLVIACPCALVIATPVAIVSAISTAARRGVLIKGGAYLEALGRVAAIAFDKTGTLTEGQPTLVDLSCIDQCCREARAVNPLAPCHHCDDMLSAAAAVERYSTHPLAQAITVGAINRNVPALTAETVETLPGRGVQGQVDQMPVTIGSHTFLHTDTFCPPDFCQSVSEAETRGQTTMLVKRNADLLGYLAVSDPPRLTGLQTISALKATGIAETVMLTGDNKTVAANIGHQIGVDTVKANLLPADKVQAIRDLIRRYGNRVAMVGDGVNDTPALAAASVGIAMGAGGSAQALETADVALMADDLSQLPWVIDLGRRAISTIKFNIWLSILIKIVFLTTALFGVATLWMAVLADMGASLVVTLNGMRLLSTRDE